MHCVYNACLLSAATAPSSCPLLQTGDNTRYNVEIFRWRDKIRSLIIYPAHISLYTGYATYVGTRASFFQKDSTVSVKKICLFFYNIIRYLYIRVVQKFDFRNRHTLILLRDTNNNNSLLKFWLDNLTPSRAAWGLKNNQIGTFFFLKTYIKRIMSPDFRTNYFL